MKGIVLLTGLCLSTALLAAPPPYGGLVDDIQGKVLLNKGEGLFSITDKTEVADGDKIVTLNKSRASLKLTEGCVIELKENQVYILDRRLGCLIRPLGVAPAPVISLALPAPGLGIVTGALLGNSVVSATAINRFNRHDNLPISAE